MESTVKSKNLVLPFNNSRIKFEDLYTVHNKNIPSAICTISYPIKQTHAGRHDLNNRFVHFEHFFLEIYCP